MGKRIIQRIQEKILGEEETQGEMKLQLVAEGSDWMDQWDEWGKDKEKKRRDFTKIKKTIKEIWKLIRLHRINSVKISGYEADYFGKRFRITYEFTRMEGILKHTIEAGPQFVSLEEIMESKKGFYPYLTAVDLKKLFESEDIEIFIIK